MLFKSTRGNTNMKKKNEKPIYRCGACGNIFTLAYNYERHLTQRKTDCARFSENTFVSRLLTKLVESLETLLLTLRSDLEQLERLYSDGFATKDIAKFRNSIGSRLRNTRKRYFELCTLTERHVMRMKEEDDPTTLKAIREYNDEIQKNLEDLIFRYHQSRVKEPLLMSDI